MDFEDTFGPLYAKCFSLAERMLKHILQNADTGSSGEWYEMYGSTTILHEDVLNLTSVNQVLEEKISNVRYLSLSHGGMRGAHALELCMLCEMGFEIRDEIREKSHKAYNSIVPVLGVMHELCKEDKKLSDDYYSISIKCRKISYILCKK
jgi:hypothetical protein